MVYAIVSHDSHHITEVMHIISKHENQLAVDGGETRTIIRYHNRVGT